MIPPVVTFRILFICFIHADGVDNYHFLDISQMLSHCMLFLMLATCVSDNGVGFTVKLYYGNCMIIDWMGFSNLPMRAMPNVT
jgi:hypothetical protein